MSKSLSAKSTEFIWHPFTQMQIAKPPIAIKEGRGTLLIDEEGNEYIDAISSWWTSLHGHAHPYIAKKIAEQAATLEHVIFAGFTHAPAVRLAERLLQYLPDNQAKIFFSDNGSTAIEVGLKMAFQYWYNEDQSKTKVIAFEGAYHGDTFGAMSVGERDTFVAPFSPLLFDVSFVTSPAENANQTVEQIKKLVAAKDVAAIIFEPLVQGSAGMRMYAPSVLDEIIAICRDHDVLVIADEVMTGFYRTGKMFAADFLTHKPDIMALSKGLTGGVMAMGVTSCTQTIYDAFLSDQFMVKTFFHGHSFTANPIACATANASLDLLEQAATQSHILRICKRMQQFAAVLKHRSEATNVRQQGTILAFDVATDERNSYGNSIRNKLYHFFMERGILLRPLGNALYVLPPYCITDIELDQVEEAILELLDSLP